MSLRGELSGLCGVVFERAEGEPACWHVSALMRLILNKVKDDADEMRRNEWLDEVREGGVRDN